MKKQHQAPKDIRPPFVSNARGHQYKAEQNYRICELYYTDKSKPSYFDVAIQISKEFNTRITPQRIGKIIQQYGDYYKTVLKPTEDQS